MQVKKGWLAGGIAAVALAVTAAIAVPLATAGPSHWQPGLVTSWYWDLNWPVQMTHTVQVYDIDFAGSGNGTQAQVAADVSTLHAKGIKVICYMETGFWENYRADAKAYAPAWLGSNLSGYPSEKYVDVRAFFGSTKGPTGLTLRQILDNRIAQCKAEGFDGVETDGDSTYTDKTGFPITMAQNESFNQTFAGDIHADGMAWFLKNGINGDSFVSDQATAADGTVNEQCWQYKECGELSVFVSEHRPILNAEYTGTQANVCPQALKFPMSSARFPVSLNGKVTWTCW